MSLFCLHIKVLYNEFHNIIRIFELYLYNRLRKSNLKCIDYQMNEVQIEKISFVLAFWMNFFSAFNGLTNTILIGPVRATPEL